MRAKMQANTEGASILETPSVRSSTVVEQKFGSAEAFFVGRDACREFTSSLRRQSHRRRV